ncbi:MAG TPA: hypothetical protein H9883_08115 [Candidatus Ruthenibacterium merdigallinarum]|nr:hypothetical protein [Candidatus Ruthenibacterium merdigallinarum]
MRQMAFIIASAMLCALLALTGCQAADAPSASSAPSAAPPASGPAEQEAAPVELTLFSKGGIGPPGVTTENGFYELAVTGTLARNILYTDFATGTRVFLCNRPECTHRDASCTSYVPGATYLFPMDGKIGILQEEHSASADDRRAHVYSVNYDGSGRTELFALDPLVSIQGGMATDGAYFYFIAAIQNEETASYSNELVRIDLADGSMTSMKTYDQAPLLVDVIGDRLILETAEETPEAVVYQFFTVRVTDGEETTFFESPYEPFSLNGTVYAVDPQTDVLYAAQVDGTVKELPLTIDLPEDVYITSAGDEPSPQGYVMLTAYKNGEGQRYLIDAETGEGMLSTLTYEWYDGTLNPIYLLTQTGERLLVIYQSGLANMEYIEEDGRQSVRETIKSDYAFLAMEDYLSNTPNYTPIEDMLSAVFEA